MTTIKNNSINTEKNAASVYSHKRKLRLLFVLILMVTLVIIIFSIDSKDPEKAELKTVKNISGLKSVGEGMKFISFTKENKKALEIQCRSSEETKGNKRRMKKIVATLYPRSRSKSSVQISGDIGIVEDNLQNFLIKENARIVSDDFQIDSERFHLKDRNLLTTDSALTYKTKNMDGKAKRLKMVLDHNMLEFNNTVGIYTVKDKKYDYFTDFLLLKDKEQLIILQKVSDVNMIKGENFFLKGNWIQTKFSEDYKYQLFTFSHNKCHFEMTRKIPPPPPVDGSDATADTGSEPDSKASENIETRIVKSDVIELYYAQNNQIDHIKTIKRTRVKIKSDSYFTDIFTDYLEMGFYLDTQVTKYIRIKSNKNKVFHRKLSEDVEDKNLMRIKGETITLNYNEDGTLSTSDISDEKLAEFSNEKYQSFAKNISHNFETKELTLQNNSTIKIDKKYKFQSPSFTLNTGEEILTTKKTVKAKISLSSSNALLSEDPLYISANELKMDERNKSIEFKDKVVLLQDNVSVNCKAISIKDEKSIIVRGNKKTPASIRFENNNEEITLKGKIIDLGQQSQAIRIEGGGILETKSSSMKADNFTIIFNKENKIKSIIGSGNISFIKDGLSIQSTDIKWNYIKEIAQFSGLKELKKQGTATVVGNTVILNLKDNSTTVLSEGDERSESILD